MGTALKHAGPLRRRRRLEQRSRPFQRRHALLVSVHRPELPLPHSSSWPHEVNIALLGNVGDVVVLASKALRIVWQWQQRAFAGGARVVHVACAHACHQSPPPNERRCAVQQPRELSLQHRRFFLGAVCVPRGLFGKGREREYEETWYEILKKREEVHRATHTRPITQRAAQMRYKGPSDRSPTAQSPKHRQRHRKHTRETVVPAHSLRPGRWAWSVRGTRVTR